MRTEQEILEICIELVENILKDANVDGFGNCIVDAHELKVLLTLLHVLN